MESNKALDIITFAEGYLGIPLMSWQREMLLEVYYKSKDMKKPQFVCSEGRWHLIDAEESVV